MMMMMLMKRTTLSKVVSLRFLVSKLNFNASTCFQLLPTNQLKFEPSAIRYLTDQQLSSLIEQSLRLTHSSHNQEAERHFKSIFEAGSPVVKY